ncbi:hypothetical protein [Streptomyces eurythermus]
MSEQINMSSLASTMLQVVLPALIGLAGVVIGGTLQQRAQTRAARAADLAAHQQAVRDTVVRLAYALSVHRGHLYDRWDLAHNATATQAETTQGRRTSKASRSEVTRALYQLRTLTQNPDLLAAADTAVTATYAVKAKGENLAAVTQQDLAERHRRATTADHALLAACTQHLTR